MTPLTIIPRASPALLPYEHEFQFFAFLSLRGRSMWEVPVYRANGLGRSPESEIRQKLYESTRRA